MIMLMLVRCRAMVLYNAVEAAENLAIDGENPLLVCGGQELAGACHNQLQLAALSLPGRNVRYFAGAIRLDQIASQRQSYINGVLIQSRGSASPSPCAACRKNLHPFTECVQLLGHWGGCCGNCKWKDFGARCSAFVQGSGKTRGGGSGRGGRGGSGSGRGGGSAGGSSGGSGARAGGPFLLLGSENAPIEVD